MLRQTLDFDIPKLEARMTHIFGMCELQADVSRRASRIASVSNFLPVEYHDEVVAIDSGFNGVPLVRNDLHVVRSFAHADDAAGQKIAAAVIAGISVADLQLVAGASARRGRRL